MISQSLYETLNQTVLTLLKITEALAHEGPCPVFLWYLIWKQKFKIFNEAHQLFSEQTNFPLKPYFTDTCLVQKAYY